MTGEYRCHFEFPAGRPPPQLLPPGAVEGSYDSIRIGFGDSERDRTESWDSQVGRPPLLGLVVVGAGDAEGDAVLAGALWIVWILARAPHLARTTRVAACGRCQTPPKAGEGRGEDGLCDWRLAKKREDMVSSATARAVKRSQHGKAGAAQKTVMERGGCGVRDGCGGEGCGEGR